MQSGSLGSGGLKERGQTLTTTDAHGDNAVALALSLELAQEESRHARARHSEGMADGDGATVYVHFGRVDLQFLLAIQHL